jgi:hypothetical protein
VRLDQQARGHHDAHRRIERGRHLLREPRLADAVVVHEHERVVLGARCGRG